MRHLKMKKTAYPRLKLFSCCPLFMIIKSYNRRLNDLFIFFKENDMKKSNMDAKLKGMIYSLPMIMVIGAYFARTHNGDIDLQIVVLVLMFFMLHGTVTIAEKTLKKVSYRKAVIAAIGTCIVLSLTYRTAESLLLMLNVKYGWGISYIGVTVLIMLACFVSNLLCCNLARSKLIVKIIKKEDLSKAS